METHEIVHKNSLVRTALYPVTIKIKAFPLVFFATGRLAIPFESAYCVSKYAVEALSDAIRRELSPWGVQVSMVEPGGHKTGIFKEGIFKRTMHDLWNNLSPELKNDYGEQYRDRGNIINC